MAARSRHPPCDLSRDKHDDEVDIKNESPLDKVQRLDSEDGAERVPSPRRHRRDQDVQDNRARPHVGVSLGTGQGDGSRLTDKYDNIMGTPLTNKRPRISKMELRLWLLTHSNVTERIHKLPFYLTLGGPKTVEDRDGLKWVLRRGNKFDLDAWLDDEPSISGLLLSLMNSGETFIDIGAGVGKYSVRAAAKGMKVRSFEPNADSREILATNLKINNLHGATRDFALGATEGNGRLVFQYPATRVLDAGDIEVRPLDVLGLEPNLIKIDVDGEEAQVLIGAKSTLTTHRPDILIEVHPWITPNVDQECKRLLKEYGYERVIDIMPIGRGQQETRHILGFGKC